MAARGKTDGEQSLILLDVDAPDGAPTVFALGKFKLYDIHWAGPTRLLLSVLAPSLYEGEPIEVGRLILFDIATSVPTVLDQNSSGIFGGAVLYVDPAGRSALISSQRDLYETPSVKRIDLVTGKESIEERARPKVWDWFADAHGTVRAGVAYADDRWTLWYRERTGEPLAKIKGRFDDEGAVDSMKFTANGGGMIVTNARTGRFGLYRYDFKSGAVGDAVYENPTVDIDDVIFDDQTGAVSGVRYEDERRHVKWLDPRMRDLQAALDKALPGAENDVVSLSADRNRVLVWSGSAADPGAYYLLDRAAHRMNAVVQVNDRIDPSLLAPVTATAYTARDGLRIPAYLTMPKGHERRGLPLIVMPHGGPFVRDDWSYDPIVQFLASRGYAVLQPQFRGSTGYGKDFVEKGYGQWGRAMQDDLDDGVDWLVRSGIADPGGCASSAHLMADTRRCGEQSATRINIVAPPATPA